MKIEIDTVKGFQDFLPPESLKRKAIKQVIEKYFSLYGFLPVETPTIEFDELMRPESLPSDKEDEAVSDRFRLKDRAGRNLGLRYEFTFQLERIFKLNPNIKLPFRRYQIGSVFRDEPTGANRFREFTQCDADIIGDPGIEADAECLALFADIIKTLGIEAETEVNNRKLLSSIIESVQITDIKNVMKELDKIGKVEEDLIKANLKKFAEPSQIITLFRLLEKPLEFFLDNAFDGADEIEKLRNSLKNYGVEIKFNPALARGLGYYTGNIFEIKANDLTIAGGGRYDKLVGRYLEKEIPAVGISFGFGKLTALAKIETEKTKAILISLNKDKEMLKLIKKLRKQGVSCIPAYGKPSQSLDYANSYGIPYAIFIGQEELTQEKFKLKNLETGEEKMLSEKQLINALAK